MKRKFTRYLDEWRLRETRKPLIVRGARQIGKTYIIEEFGKSNYEQFVKVDFEEIPELIGLFATNDVFRIRQDIEVFFNTKLIDGKTLLFLDEIQLAPKAIAALRYFYEKMPEVDVIAVGSLLDHTLNDLGFPMPVGRVEFAYMYPMDFIEFLDAANETSLVDFIQKYQFPQPIATPIHEKILRYVRLYYVIGGMPEAVKKFVEDNNLPEVERVHESILKSLEYDFSKYGTRSQQSIMIKLLKYIPTAIGQKFKYSNAVPEQRAESIRAALALMEMSRLIALVKSTSASGVPLSLGVSERAFKPLFLDIGLANHLLRLRLTDIDNLNTINEGSLAEQFVGQQLQCSEQFYIESELYYWMRNKRNSEAEIDFVEESNNLPLPIEVKAGKSGTLKSLQVYMFEKKLELAVRFNTDQPTKTNIDTSVRVGTEMCKVRFNLVSLPLYLVSEYSRIINSEKLNP
ncbi:MAG: AAA family ATPase [Bacteroidales bacterium]|nr:AAA family ATPase [Bacteroidales bacterium]